MLYKCVLDRAGAINDIVPTLSIFADVFLALIVYCCNSRPIFRLCVAAVMVISEHCYLKTKYSIIMLKIILAILATSYKFTPFSNG